MADSPHRASITSRTASPEDWDAGVHADSDAGPIDIGLSVEPTALGLVVEAPGVGTLRVAFDVSSDGTTTLAKATRRLADGRDVPLVVIDEGQLLRTQGELARFREAAQAERQALEDEVSRLTAALQAEQAQAREAATARDGLRDELTALRASPDVTGADDTRRQLEAAELKAATLSASVTALEAELREREAELERSRSAAAAADTQLTEVQNRAVAEAADARAHVATLEEQLADTGARAEALEAELAAAKAMAEAAQGRLQKAEVELTDATLRATALETDDGKATLARELEETKAALAAAQAALAQQGPLAGELAEANAALAAAQAELAQQGPIADEVATLRHEIELARASLEEKESDLGRREDALALAVEQKSALEARLAVAEAMPPPAADGTKVVALTAQLEAVRAALLSSETELARRDDSLALAVEQRDALQAQLASVDDALTAQRRATDEARDVARRLKTQADGLLAERDEARAVARQLHQRLSTYRGNPTEPEMPAVSREGATTDPMIPKKKGP